MALTKITGEGLGTIDSADLDGAVTINESSADKDFRVESNGNANMLFVDGGNNRVGIGLSDPSDIFEVSNSADTPTRAIVTAEDSAGSNQNAFIKTKAKGSYYEGLEMASTDGHIGMWGGYYSSSAVLQARVGGSGVNSSDVLAMQIDANGHVTTPSQPSFQVHPAALQENIAYNTWTTVVFGTERYDTNGDFASNVFTAPVAGKYIFTFNLDMRDMDDDVAGFYWVLNTSNKIYYAVNDIQDLADSDLGSRSHHLSVVADMDASDTCNVRVWHNGSTNMDIHTDSFFSGALLG